MSVHHEPGYKPNGELPSGMFTKMLAVSIGSVVGACLLALAIFSI